MSDDSSSSGKKATTPDPTSATSAPPAPVPTEQSTLEQARRFLQDDEVRQATRDRKIEFLKSKGIDEAHITQLLAEEEQRESIEDQQQQPSQEVARSASEPSQDQTATTTTTTTSQPPSDRPPIVTYPEFLTKPTKPPPFMTVNRFLNTVYAFAGLSTLVYGTSKLVLEPMVQSQTEARLDLHASAASQLDRIIEKLEASVSEVPPFTPGQNKLKQTTAPAGAAAEDDEDAKSSADSHSSYEDPAELFHRDIGVQTSPPPTPAPYDTSTTANNSSDDASASAAAKASSRLAELTASVKSVCEGFASQSEDYGDVAVLLDQLREDVDKISSAAAAAEFAMSSSGANSYSFYGGGGGGRNEPEDEIRQAKENIRRVKGVLLSTRNFPMSTR